MKSRFTAATVIAVFSAATGAIAVIWIVGPQEPVRRTVAHDDWHAESPVPVLAPVIADAVVEVDAAPRELTGPNVRFVPFEPTGASKDVSPVLTQSGVLEEDVKDVPKSAPVRPGAISPPANAAPIQPDAPSLEAQVREAAPDAGDEERRQFVKNLEQVDPAIVPQILKAYRMARELAGGGSNDRKQNTPAPPQPENSIPSVVRKMLPDADQVEVDVFSEEFKDLPLAAVEEILRIRENPQRSTGIAIVRERPNLPPLPLDVEEPARIGERTEAFRFESDHGEFAPEFSASRSAAETEPTNQAILLALNVCLNNIANAATTGFKRSSVQLQSMKPIDVKLPGQQDASGKSPPIGIAIGLGVEVGGTRTDWSQGTLKTTQRPLDVAIHGDGLFQVTNSSEVLYTRSGAFAVNAEGELVLATATGNWVLEPSISVPADATAIQISSDGLVAIQQPGVASLTSVGQLQLARFVNPAGLVHRGSNLYAESGASGSPQVGSPGIEGHGEVQQGKLEHSNVDLRDELATMQRLRDQLQALQEAHRILDSVHMPFNATYTKRSTLR
ncbi:MAG: hypothetical protein CMJ48_02605 [Planctomycetaceae bacterium]|nr:hypothetical protein [Planctomycetaceae bacterium]